MAAEIYTAVVRPATGLSLDKPRGGGYPLDATAVTALQALTTANTVQDVQDLLSAVYERGHEVAPNQIGKATSDLN